MRVEWRPFGIAKEPQAAEMETELVIVILFDVDGTLTATNAVDAKCYCAAFGRVFGAPLPTTDWDVYADATDSGIIHEVLLSLCGRRATVDELKAFENAFVEALQAEYAQNPAGFNEIPGARAILGEIGTRNNMRAAIASGGMRGSASYKLSRIGVDAAAIPGSYANDATTRQAIAQCAVARCLDAHGDGPAAHEIVYVGDGPWDVRTSADLGMRFIGITGDAPADKLRAEGATLCLADFVDQDAFFAALAEAEAPRPQARPRSAR